MGRFDLGWGEVGKVMDVACCGASGEPLSRRGDAEIDWVSGVCPASQGRGTGGGDQGHGRRGAVAGAVAGAVETVL